MVSYGGVAGPQSYQPIGLQAKYQETTMFMIEEPLKPGDFLGSPNPMILLKPL